MVTEKRLHEDIDNARLLIKLSLISGIGSAVLALIVTFSGITSDWAGSDVYALIVVPYLMALLFSAAAFTFGILGGGAARENEEKSLLEKRKESAAFNVEEDVRFTAARSFENYTKYAPYVLAALGALIVLGLALLFWRYWSFRAIKPLPASTLHAAFVAVILMCLSIFAGAFCIGQSHDIFFRWLRPVGAWLIAAFVVSLLAMASALALRLGYPGADRYLSRIILVLYGVLGAEFVFNFVVEFYRPRTIEVPRPVFESRILSLFTEPGGVVRNIADTLDYQFGFKVSGTWIYAFMEKSLFPLLLAWLIILWLFSGFHEVGPNEIGIRERFGKICSEQLLESGIYYTLPAPFGTITRFSCSKIHEVAVGEIEEIAAADVQGKKTAPEVVVWTEKHSEKDFWFLVASEAMKGSDSNMAPVSFLSVTMPVQYRIRKEKIVDYAYRNKEPEKILQNIGTQMATRYFASVSMQEIMSFDRHKAGEQLKKDIQAGADALGLGVEIVAVNLLDAHPPVEKVAPAYQDVIGAMEERETEILKALIYQEQVLPAVLAEQMRLVSEAKSYCNNVSKVSKAESERFLKQLQAYSAMPRIYKLRTYLTFLEKDCKDIRKYIMGSSITSDIYEVNFEEKTRLDLLDANLGAIK